MSHRSHRSHRPRASLRFLSFLPPLALLAANTVAGQQTFDAARFLPAADAGAARAIGDLDADGDPDVVRTGSNGFTALLNVGGELVAGPSVASAAALSADPRLGDVDGDGFPDLVFGIVQPGPVHALRVYSGDGTGAFGAPLDVPIPYATFGLAQTALLQADGDAALEIAVLADTTVGITFQDFRFDVALYDWNGAGFDESPRVAAVGGRHASSVAVTDVDGDGDQDLVVPDAQAGFYQLFPTVAGTPTVGATTPLPAGVWFFVAGDADGDGDEDLVAAGRGGGLPGQIVYRLAVLERTAPGTWVPGPVSETPFTGIGGMAVRPWLGDWDGDGDLDVFNAWNRAYQFENDGGAFTLASQPLVEKRSSAYGSGAGTADFDGDGKLDLVGPRALLFGDGTFRDAPAPLGGVSLDYLLPADWEGDGDVDLVHRDGTVSVNDGTGAFAPTPPLYPPAPAGFTFGGGTLVPGDLDGDGLADALRRFFELVPDPDFGMVPEYRGMRLLLGTPAGGYADGGLATPLGFPDDFLVTGGTSGGIDVDGDGDPDLLDASVLWINDGTGAFDALPIGAGAGDGTCHAGDVEGDGDVDLLVYDDLGGSLAYRLLRAAGGGFVSEALATKVDGGLAGRLFDLDGDGDLDAVLPSDFDGASLTLLENDGAGFVPAGELAGHAPNCQLVEHADVDLDGSPDLVTGAPTAHLGSSIEGDVAWFLHTGGLAFDPVRETLATGVFGLADLDEDGDLDVASQTTRLVGQVRTGAASGLVRQSGAGTAGLGGVVAVLGASGPLRSGSAEAGLHVRRGRGGALALLGIATSPFALPAPALGRSAGAGADYGGAVLVRMRLGGAPGVAAVGRADLPLVVRPALLGRTFHLRAYVLDGAADGGIAATNLLEIRFAEE